MIDEAYKLVESFQKAAGQPVSKIPCQLKKERVEIRTKWMEEELQEFMKAQDIYAQADAMIDLLYYLLGTCVEMGIKPDALFQIVHKSNMKKLEVKSSIIKDSDGKVKKPPLWTHPDIAIKDTIKSMQSSFLQENSSGLL